MFPTLDGPRPSVDHDQQDKSAEAGEQRGEEFGNGVGARGDEMSWEPTLPHNTGNTMLENGVDEEDALMHNLRVSNESILFQRPDPRTTAAEANPLHPSQPTEPTEDEDVDEAFFRSCQDDPNV